MQQKQAIPFQGGAALDDFDGRLFVASGREVYALVPVPFEKQVGSGVVCFVVCCFAVFFLLVIGVLVGFFWGVGWRGGTECT